jgi:hypothetical protein
MGSALTIGADIGPRRDPTAVAVAEINRRAVEPNRTQAHFLGVAWAH